MKTISHEEAAALTQRQILLYDELKREGQRIRNADLSDPTIYRAAEAQFDALFKRLEQAKMDTDPGPGHFRTAWARHWMWAREGLERQIMGMRFHEHGGMEATLTEGWKRERKAMLYVMRDAVASGITRISKTSSQPVFTDRTGAARLNPEGCALSWDQAVAKRQMKAANLEH